MAVRVAGIAVAGLAGLVIVTALARVRHSRRQHEAALRSEMSAIMAAAQEALVVIDRAGMVRAASLAACRQCGRTLGQVVGLPFWEAFPDLHSMTLEQRCRHAAHAGEPFEATMFSTIHRRWFSVRGHPFSGGLAMSLRDLTAERPPRPLDVLGQLTGSIAHDINNLLTIVLGNFEMLALQAEDSEPPRLLDLELIRAGLGAGQSASDLMRRLLAFSRRQAVSPRALDVAALLAELEPLLRQSLGQAIALRVDCPPELWPVLADRLGLESVLLNLALNSRDAMPRGGVFALSAANCRVDEATRVALGLERAGDYVIITAADGGHGMSPEVLERAFEPFFTTKPQGAGTGLGLAMAHAFAKQSGGLLSVTSSQAQGTTMTLFMPRTTQIPQPEPLLGRVPRPVAQGTATILLVEDHERVRTHTADLLRDFGYGVIQAEGGQQAIDILKRQHPDLLLTDVVMAGEYDGRELAEHAARLLPDLPVLFMSGYPEAVLLESGRLLQGNELLAKPFRPSELADRVAKRLDARKSQDIAPIQGA